MKSPTKGYTWQPLSIPTCDKLIDNKVITSFENKCLVHDGNIFQIRFPHFLKTLLSVFSYFNNTVRLHKSTYDYCIKFEQEF